MSLQIPIQKDIGEYEEKIVGKMSLRSLVCVAGGFASAIGAASISYFALGIEVSNAAFPVMCASMPFWLAGFWRPFDMRAEKFLPLFANHHVKEQKLLYTAKPDPAIPTIKPPKTKGRAWRRKGAESYEPTAKAA